MHADQRSRSSLATDLMEPARPAADEIILDLLEAHPFTAATLLRRGKASCASDGRSRGSPPVTPFSP
jgi:CRISPR/Cas system-associated endonuclease Cas1